LKPVDLLLLLRDDDVRRRHEHGDGGDDSEGREGDQAQPVQHHGRELPVVLDLGRVLVVANLVRDHADLLEDQAELPVNAGRVGRRRRRSRSRGRARRPRSAPSAQKTVWQLPWGRWGR